MDPLRHLPPLITLRAFEAAARLLSFSRAADELFVTQSAISHHIQKLEKSVGTALFVRRVRAVTLTPHGQAYHRQVREALDLLVRATEALRTEPCTQLRVGLLPSFAARWLVPRLAGFTAAHPGISLQLVPDIALADVAGGEVDLAIRYGRGNWADQHVVKLMPERLLPVCAPVLLGRRKQFKTAADMLRHPLLMSHSRQPFEWELWSRQFGADVSAAPVVKLYDYNIVLEAALAGQGVAMGRQRLIADHLASGALRPALANAVLEDKDVAWWLVLPRNSLSAAAAAFCTWMQAEAVKSMDY